MAARTKVTAASIHCAICGRQAPGSYRRSSTGESFCSSHPWCIHCRTAHTDPSCDEQRQIVTSNIDAATRRAQILRDLQALQIDLPTVPLSLVSTMPGFVDGRCFKLFGGGTRSRSARIEIQAGLGPTRFGHVVAHEHAHALLHLHGGPSVDPNVEEGVCELVAVVWLTNHGARQEVLNDVWVNPHPAYGEQMRQLVRLSRRVGVRRVLASVLATGKPE